MILLVGVLSECVECGRQLGGKCLGKHFQQVSWSFRQSTVGWLRVLASWIWEPAATIQQSSTWLVFQPQWEGQALRWTLTRWVPWYWKCDHYLFHSSQQPQTKRIYCSQPMSIHNNAFVCLCLVSLESFFFLTICGRPWAKESTLHIIVLLT